MPPQEQRPGPSRRAILVAAVALLAVVIVIVVVLTSGGGVEEEARRPPGPTGSSSASPPTGTESPTPGETKTRTKPKPKPPSDVRFRVARIQAIRGRKHVTPRVIQKATRRAVRNVTRVLDRLYTAGFVDAAGHARPAGGIFADFAGSARRIASQHPSVLTLGSRGRRVTDLRAGGARLKVRVLLDEHNQPATVVATALFTARAHLRSGRVLLVSSSARYFMRPGADGWFVVAFQARRHDRTLKG